MTKPKAKVKVKKPKKSLDDTATYKVLKVAPYEAEQERAALSLALDHVREENKHLDQRVTELCQRCQDLEEKAKDLVGSGSLARIGALEAWILETVNTGQVNFATAAELLKK